MKSVPNVTGKQPALDLQDGMTLAQAARNTTQALQAAGIDGASRDARALVAAASRRPALDLIAYPDADLNDAAAVRLEAMVQRRMRCEPVSRIIGEREFYGRTFQVNRATLDPRPDTETLVDAALEISAQEGFRDQPIRILDIGTGSGCVIVTLLAEFPSASGVATDISPAALAIAAVNADRLGVADRLELRQADALEGIDDRYSLIVCNPPYIPSADIASLARDVRDYDPVSALDGGSDGMQIFQRIAPRLQSVIGSGETPGWAIFEVGAYQASSVADILAANGLPACRTWKDLGGHTRCVAVRSLG